MPLAAPAPPSLGAYLVKKGLKRPPLQEQTWQPCTDRLHFHRIGTRTLKEWVGRSGKARVPTPVVPLVAALALR
jgi:hypothetical protein